MDGDESEDQNSNVYDGFEEEMDNFWKDEDPSHQYLDDDGSEFLDEGSVLEFDGYESEVEEMPDEDQINEGEINRILEEEEEELLRENGLEDVIRKEDTPEKIILDSLNVEKLINMLSKVRLAWPEDLPSYNATDYNADPDRIKFSESFYHCTDKEKTVMWHAENFRRQFHHEFPERRPLLIAPKNETGTQKLFPTYINPTVLGYPEFLDCITLTNYMKDFLTPEQMDPPTRVPDRTRSHATVLKDRKANCFEFAVIIVSLLNGAGYDSYAVDGYASKTVCTMDATEDYVEPSEEPENFLNHSLNVKSSAKVGEDSNQGEFKDIFDREDDEKALRPVSPSKYRFKKATQAFSKHEAEMTKRDSQVSTRASVQHEHDLSLIDIRRAEAEEAEEAEEEMAKEQEEDKKANKPRSFAKPKPPEKFHKIRTHSWILVLPGKRDIDEAFFLEPFSGTKFPLVDENFQGIESIFNEKNYYVNIQDTSGGLGELSYDLNDPSKWSKLLLEPERKKKSQAEEDSLFQDEEDDTPKKAEMLLEMPASWTPDLDISQEDYERKYPDGKKTFNYNDAIVELAAAYANDDGLVKKVLKFNGQGRNPEDLIYIEEIFEHRKDKLIRRKWVRQGRLLHEYFEQGRRDALKEHVHISGKNNPSYPRNLFYYSNSHPQNVAHRQIVRKGMIEKFEGRDDLLYYRATSYGSVICNVRKQRNTDAERRDSHTASKSKAKAFLEMLKGDTNGTGTKKRIRRKIAKIIEKYHQDESKDFTEDIAEKHMLIDEGRLRILFHYGAGNLTRNSLEFFKPRGLNVDTNEFKPEDCVEYQVDRHAPPMDVYEKFKILQKMEAAQRVASVLAVQAENEVYQTVTSRVQEDWHHEIEPDAFAGDRNEEYIKIKEQKVAEDEEDEEDLDDIDFATPFFEKFGVPKTKQEEILMKKRIMLNAKVKLVKKAHSIRESYERESSHLREKLVWHDRHIEKMTPTQEEDFGHVYKDRLFEMHIMEQRLTRHQELAPKKYYDLLLAVLKHTQLNRFSNKKIPPPKPVITGPTDEELAKAARELAKAKDCCQFYTVKYTEPKKDEKKNQIQAEVAELSPPPVTSKLQNP